MVVKPLICAQSSTAPALAPRKGMHRARAMHPPPRQQAGDPLRCMDRKKKTRLSYSHHTHLARLVAHTVGRHARILVNTGGPGRLSRRTKDTDTRMHVAAAEHRAERLRCMFQQGVALEVERTVVASEVLWSCGGGGARAKDALVVGLLGLYHGIACPGCCE